MRLAAIATVAGAFSGLFGVGGGAIIVPLLVLWLGYEHREATGTSLAAIAVIAALAAGVHAVYGNVDLWMGLLVAAPAVARSARRHRASAADLRAGGGGGVRGPADRLRGGARPLMDALDVIGLLALGFAAGIAGGLFGVGGGVLFVPALVVFADLSQLEAIATSLVAVVIMAAVGAARQREYGNIRLRDGLADRHPRARWECSRGSCSRTPCPSERSSSPSPRSSSSSLGNSRERRACARFLPTWRSSTSRPRTATDSCTWP